jgi:excisionase family DNA binding protein
MALADSTSENGFAPRIGRSVSIDHAAELLGVSRRTIYNRIRDGRLRTIRTIGHSQRVLVESLFEQSEPGADPRSAKPELVAAGRPAL